ncbi:hypothetical protein MKK68_24175 [Methylobacterium sp. E-016]|uniref:hypothetical protein n=1 Tax=Methylobacterium sp. E-016 TaxID=2836556 RepID=UPI001FBAC74F|nr:hypothetical protein [Methylobacterium sp. E-016]MCJ2078703.1 hypothetical protein [Methylobacterium sp. E-016]
MIVEPKSRFFQQYDLHLWASRNQGEPLKFKEDDDTLDVLSLLQSAIGKDVGKINVGVKDECKITRVNLSADKKYAAILFQRSSPDASTPFFSSRKTGKLKKADRDVDEDIAVSAHLFVDMEHIALRKGRYRAIVEEVPSLGKSYIQTIFHKILKSQEYSFNDRNGNEKTTFTACKLDGYKSQSLSDALKKGTVPYVELVRTPTVEGLDSESFQPKEQKQKIMLRVGGASVIEKLKTVKAWAVGQGWSEVRVQVRLPDGRARVVPVGRDDDAAAVLFVRAEQVYVEKELDVCCENVSPQLLEKAVAMFAKKWTADP